MRINQVAPQERMFSPILYERSFCRDNVSVFRYGRLLKDRGYRDDLNIRGAQAQIQLLDQFVFSQDRRGFG